MKPLLRWVGGKYNQRLITDRLIELYAPYRSTHTWVEPFCGGLGATFRVMPEKAILSDSNAALIRFYQSIKDGNEFVKEYEGYGYQMLRSLLNVELLRELADKPPTLISTAEFATIFYLVNRLCFNGLWRVSRSGRYNVPQGRNSKGELLTASLPDLSEYFQVMDQWSFDCCDWQKQLSQSRDGKPVNQEPMFIYADPVYDKTFANYTSSGFDWFRQKQLAQWASVSSHPVVISNAATDRILELYIDLGFNIEFIEAKRSVSCDGNRNKVKEILAYKLTTII